MPSTATITAFYSFTANTKARASQVEWNFAQLRGHIIPIDPNTQTAVSNTYDLGSTEYYWRTIHTKAIVKGVVGPTLTVAQSGFGRSALVGYGATTVATHMAGSTITVTTAGEPVEIAFSGGLFGPFYSAGTTTANLYTTMYAEILLNGASLTTFQWSVDNLLDRFDDKRLPAGAFKYIDFPAAGANIYSVRYFLLNATQISFISFPTYLTVRGLY